MKSIQLLSILFLYFLPGYLFSAPTKIYLMVLQSSEQDKEKASQFRKSLQSAISEDGKFSLIDEDTIKNFQEKLKKQQLLGCDETVCLKEIANALETEELMTGDFKVLANKTLVSLKLTTRNEETFEVGIKTTFSISFFESQKSYYIKEIIKKIHNPLYTINDSSAPSPGGTGTSTTKLPFLKLPSKLVVNEIEKKNLMENPSDANFYNNFIYEGVQALKKREYKKAEETFLKAEKYALDKKLNSESLSLSLYKDLVILLPLESSLTENYNIVTRVDKWSINKLKEEILPFYERQMEEKIPTLFSTEGKRFYSEWREVLYTTYLLLSGEQNQLLYSSNKIEEFASSFRNYEKIYNRFKLDNSKIIPYITENYSNLSSKNKNIEKEYLPTWNLELQKNCITLYYASKVFPKIQKITKEDYSETFNSLDYLYNNTNSQLIDGKNVLSDLTRRSCEGVKN